MSLRGSLFGILAVGLLGLASGCTDTAKDERNALLTNNADLTRQNEALKTQNDGLSRDLEVARAAGAANNAPKSVTDTTVLGGGNEAPIAFANPPKGASKAAAKAGSSETIEISADVLFDSGKSALKPEAKKSLDALVAKLKGASHVTIEGHTDNIPFKKGSTMTNEKLGQNRAQAVTTYLISKGVAKDHLTAISKGDKEPKSTTNQAANRRVTFIVEK